MKEVQEELTKSELLNYAKFIAGVLDVDYEDTETFVKVINMSYHSLSTKNNKSNKTK